MKGTAQKQRNASKSQKEVTTKNSLQKTSDFFEHNRTVLFIICMITGVLMSILLFDVKVSQSGDDSDYLIYANDFWRHFTFPGFRGPLYPIILAPIIGIFGFNLILVKSLSAIFILLSIWLLYKSFQDKIPAMVLMPALLLTCLCSYLFFYASHTYSEPFFMLMQSLFIFYFSKYFLATAGSPARLSGIETNGVSCSIVQRSLKTDWPKYLILGGIVLGMGLTRSIGFSVLGVVILFFAIDKRLKDLAYTLAAAILVFCIFQLIKTVVWPDAGSAYDIKNYLAKDYYNPVESESFLGFLNRLTVNSKVYLSAFLCQFMGVMPETPSNLLKTDTTRTIVIYLLFFFCLFMVFRCNKALLFTGLYAGVLNFVSFVILQTIWGQDRLIVIYYPLIILLFLGGFYYLFQFKAIQKFFFVYPLIILILFVGTISITTSRIERNFSVLQENILGDPLYGFTPDWYNFIKGSQWAAQNLDENAVIVSRKPSISTVYTGRKFTWSPTDITVPYDIFALTQSTENQVIVVASGLHISPYLQYIIGSRKTFPFKEKIVNGVQVYRVPGNELDTFLQTIQNENMDYTLDYKPFFDNLPNEDFRIYDPEMLLNYLIENDIRYLLLPQLRVDPTRNTGVFINNVHRFIWFISCKYPDRFRTVYVEGKEEPCEIIEFIR
ncbi:MAG: glycosyltransferase family 39 protein [Tannerella sp.]|jgi:hypothetical protein|nr:glycosyltransferase family 39 protein [Tannerella sp.]